MLHIVDVHQGYLLNFIKSKKSIVGCYNGYIAEKIKNQNNGYRHRSFKRRSNFPFKDKIFDVVLGGEVIEHIFDTD